MTDAATKEKTVGQPQPAPEVKPPVTKEKAESFGDALIQRVDDIAPLLPSHIKKERFIAAAHAAVKQNPELLECTVRSLFNALTKAAQDGLLPDGREGVITSYNTKVEVDGKEKYVKAAAWNPMAYGLRKRARELDGIIIDAQVVHENDHFVWHQGDEPRIEHEPAKLGTDRGPLIGVYAIFKRESGVILHREIMDKSQVMATKNQSKAKTSLMWTTFETEGWRKASVRRGMKTVPVGEDLERIITRDDENFDFSQSHHDTLAIQPPPAPPPAPKASAASVIEGTIKKTDAPSAPVDEYADWLRDSYAELDGCTSEAAVEDLRDRLLAELRPCDADAWKLACAEKSTTLFKGK